jgi:preprotein translocase subunit YajC
VKKSKFWGLILLGLLVTLVTLIGCIPTTQGQEEQPTGLQSTLPMIIILILLFAMFYFLMIRPARQREKKQKEIITSLQPGDIVITASGIFGKIESMREDSVVLKVESGATIRVLRSSILGRPDSGGTA